MRSTLLACLFAALLWLSGCASPAPSPTAFASPEPIVLQEEDAPTTRPGKSKGSARLGEWLYKTPMNILWWPWKMIGHGLRGIPDGIIAGFDEGRMAFLGLIVSPVNAATGFLTGFVEGAFMSPAFITPETDLGRTFEKPTKTPTTIWWYWH